MINTTVNNEYYKLTIKLRHAQPSENNVFESELAINDHELLECLIDLIPDKEKKALCITKAINKAQKLGNNDTVEFLEKKYGRASNSKENGKEEVTPLFSIDRSGGKGSGGKDNSISR